MSQFTTETGEFKGNKTISIMEGDKRRVSFGVKKAKAIIECFEDIKKFVEEADKESTTVDLDALTPDQRELVQQFVKK